MKKLLLTGSMLLFVLLNVFAGAVPALAPNEGFVIMHNLPLYVEKNGTLEWKENLILGDRVIMLNRTNKFTVNKAEREYVKVKSPMGNEGWVRSAYVVQKALLAVVQAPQAIVYTAPRDVNMTTKYISNMTVVAVLQEGTTSEYAKVVCYDPVQDAYYTDPVFISSSDLTFNEVDVNAIILFTSGKSTKDKTLRQNFFKKINAKYPTTIFFQQIKDVLSPDVSAQKATAPASGTFTVNDNNVNVRNAPDEVNGQVTAQVSKGTVVEVTEATAQTYTIGNLTGPWYKIKNPEGWVFGPFLTPNN